MVKPDLFDTFRILVFGITVVFENPIPDNAFGTRKIVKSWDSWDRLLSAINSVTSVSQACPKVSQVGTLWDNAANLLTNLELWSTIKRKDS